MALVRLGELQQAIRRQYEQMLNEFNGSAGSLAGGVPTYNDLARQAQGASIDQARSLRGLIAQFESQLPQSITRTIRSQPAINHQAIADQNPHGIGAPVTISPGEAWPTIHNTAPYVNPASAQPTATTPDHWDITSPPVTNGLPQRFDFNQPPGSVTSHLDSSIAPGSSQVHGVGSTTTATSNQLPHTPSEPYQLVPHTRAVESAEPIVFEDDPSLQDPAPDACRSVNACTKATGWCICVNCGISWLGGYDVKENS